VYLHFGETSEVLESDRNLELGRAWEALTHFFLGKCIYTMCRLHQRLCAYSKTAFSTTVAFSPFLPFLLANNNLRRSDIIVETQPSDHFQVNKCGEL
jgi:hypothetical protein